MNTNPKVIVYQSFKYKCDADCGPLSSNIQFHETLTSPVLKTKPSESYTVLFNTYKNTHSITCKNHSLNFYQESLKLSPNVMFLRQWILKTPKECRSPDIQSLKKPTYLGKKPAIGWGWWLGGWKNIHALILSPGMAYPLRWNSKSEQVEHKYSQIISKPTIFFNINWI